MRGGDPDWRRLRDQSPRLFHAAELFTGLRNEFGAHLPEFWLRTAVEPDPDDDRFDLLVLRDESDTDMLHDWSILIGDIAHSARASLDHAVHRFVEANGGTSTNRTQFPAALKPRDVKRSPGLDGVHDRVRAAVLELQPWRGGTGHWLWVLTRLDNLDKHQVLLELSGWSQQMVTIRDLSTGTEMDEGIDTTGHSDGDVLRRAPRGTLRRGQSTGTVYLYLPSARADEWDGNTVDGYRIPAMEVLRACLQACVVALGTMTDAAVAGAEEQQAQTKS